MTMLAPARRIPPGPAHPYDPGEDLLTWIQQGFQTYGDVYKASIYGGEVYVINSPEYARYVLLTRWENFPRKGQAIKRIAMSLGHGLMSSKGAFWVTHRRMIQPAFKREAVGALLELFVRASSRLRDRWMEAARQRTSVNVTHDVSLAVLEITLRALFGEDYEWIAPHFQLIAAGSRNLEFAQKCSALRALIAELAARRLGSGIDAPDILGTMMRGRDRDSGKPMALAQVAREALTLVIAGHETTASILSWAWHVLSQHPAVDARMASEIRKQLAGRPPSLEELASFVYTRQVIEELLRLYPPGWLMTRKALQADQLGPYFVPSGTEI